MPELTKGDMNYGGVRS